MGARLIGSFGREVTHRRLQRPFETAFTIFRCHIPPESAFRVPLDDRSPETLAAGLLRRGATRFGPYKMKHLPPVFFNRFPTDSNFA